eukprot:gnl/TRDRNA2_/TRDRNA2_171567_c0_seq1.p2 gnl/TRDRNA2_/TRDRNA2_171567_c0~~gnl/TRDRNA2_/TRDRNA2_171567_c0_seq1.p2  ORF type:complete len:106 (+),score=18.76 gnl/TRDRNA2_/TRDRNA2_171567_c0_seq1:405-722(+)
MAATAERIIGDLNAHHLANMAWALFNTRWSGAPVFATLAYAAQRCSGDLDTQHSAPGDFCLKGLHNMAWAFASAEELAVSGPLLAMSGAGCEMRSSKEHEFASRR